MDSKSIKKLIDEKPARFFKKLMAYHRYEDLFSGLIPKLYKESEYQWAEFFETYRNDPQKGCDIANIFRTLVEHYPFDSYDYGNKDYTDIALYIHNTYNKRIAKYMNKK